MIQTTNKLIERLAGISAINVTPFQTETGLIDENALRRNVRFLLERGMELIVPCGNTGEYYALTQEERIRVTECVAAEANGEASIVVGIGHDVMSAIELGRHARLAGADAVMIHQPVHPFVTDDGLVRYYDDIIAALDMPVIPYIRSRSVGKKTFAYLQNCPRVVGVKYAIPDVLLFAETVRSFPREHFIWVCGLAENWAPFFQRAGSRGFTSGLVNVAPELSLAMLQALREDDSQAVRRIWETIKPFEDLRAKYDSGINVSVVKEAMKLLGYNGGVVRPPADELNDEDKATLVAVLQGWNKPIASKGMK